MAQRNVVRSFARSVLRLHSPNAYDCVNVSVNCQSLVLLLLLLLLLLQLLLLLLLQLLLLLLLQLLLLLLLQLLLDSCG
jgi:hypothetical protein